MPLRYIQALYIRKKTYEARDKAREDARRQIMTVFSATEELRTEVQRREEAAQQKRAVKNLSRNLEVLETKLPSLLEMLKPTSKKLADVASSLEQVKHNLVVKVRLLVAQWSFKGLNGWLLRVLFSLTEKPVSIS